MFLNSLKSLTVTACSVLSLVKSNIFFLLIQYTVLNNCCSSVVWSPKSHSPFFWLPKSRKFGDIWLNQNLLYQSWQFLQAMGWCDLFIQVGFLFFRKWIAIIGQKKNWFQWFMRSECESLPLQITNALIHVANLKIMSQQQPVCLRTAYATAASCQRTAFVHC